MTEMDVIDVPRQEEVKMVMRQWIEYYNSPNRDKVLNVISLEVSNTRCVGKTLILDYILIVEIHWYCKRQILSRFIPSYSPCHNT